ncbi:hypothetical protein ACWDBF_00885 [Streptomyces angustmyceticus]
MVHLVLRHLSRPVLGNTYMRGVLPPQGGEEAVCVAVGTKDACAPDLNVYEIPLIQDEIIIAAGEVLQIVRAAQTADPFYRTFYRDDEGDLSQMPSLVLDLLDIRGDQEQHEAAVLAPGTERSTDRPNLVGFLPLARGRHRLYWSCGDWPGIVASDVETSNSPEALEAVVAHGLPDARRAQPSKDLYCWKIAPLLER